MPMPTDAERALWRERNADLIEFIRTPANQRRSRFITDMVSELSRWRSLTEAQTAATRRAMAEMSGESTNAVSDAATADDCPHIPNGTYTISHTDTDTHHTFQIYTPRRGSLQGKRIIKRQLTYGDFKGFAFLTREGNIRVWRSFAVDEASGEEYIIFARKLIERLAMSGENMLSDMAEDDTTETEYMFMARNPEGGWGRWSVQAAINCRSCNRQLTNPESIRLGIGPECRRAPAPAVGFGLDNTGLPVATAAEVEISDNTSESAERLRRLDEQIAQAMIASQAYNVYGVRACDYCLRDDFQTTQGRGRHITSCRRNNNNLTRVQRLEATRGSVADGTVGVGMPVRTSPRRPVRTGPSTARQTTRSITLTARRPNPSALGTIIDGSVWDQ